MERTLVDTRNLGRQAVSNGTEAAWRHWSVVLKSYVGIVNPEFEHEMTMSERKAHPVINGRLLLDIEIRRRNDLFHILLRSTSGLALDRVINAGVGERFRA